MPFHSSSSSEQQEQQQQLDAAAIPSLMQLQRSAWNDINNRIIILGELLTVPLLSSMSMDEFNERPVQLSPLRTASLSRLLPPSSSPPRPSDPTSTTSKKRRKINHHRRAHLVSILDEALDLSKSIDLKMSVPRVIEERH